VRGRQQVVGDARRDRAVPDHLGAAALLRVEQCIQRKHDADLDVHVGGACRAGDPLDEGVGHDLPAGARVALGEQRIGAPAQRGQARHPLLDGEEPAEQGHRVASRAQTDAPVGAGGAAAGHVPRRIGGVGVPAGHQHGLTGGEPPDPGRAQLLVHQAALLGIEMAGLGHDQRGGVLADLSGGQQGAHAGQLGAQGPGHAQPAGSGDRGHPARQPDLLADPAPDLPGIQPPVGDVSLDLRTGERDHLGVLGGGQRAAQPFQQRDAVHTGRLGSWPGIGRQRADFGEHRGEPGDDRVRHRLGGRRVRSHVRNPTTTHRHSWTLRPARCPGRPWRSAVRMRMSAIWPVLRELFHLIVWNDSDRRFDVPGVVTENRRNTMMTTIRRVLRRLDSWTLEVFNPRFPAGHR
jgi:hypothetical protein